MSEDQNELRFDLLTKKALYGLDETEQRQLDEFDPGTAEMDFRSLEMTAAAIGIAGLTTEEPLPEHLFAKIAADSTKHVGSTTAEIDSPWPPSYQSIDAERPARSWFGWLGWAAAVAACAALAVNIWITRIQPRVDIAQTPVQVETPKPLTAAELREEMMRSSGTLIRAKWAGGNVKEIKQITGDVIWSDEKQAGYMRFQGLPVNDAATTCYQLWIFDKTQDPKEPIDGGIFDVTSQVNEEITSNI